MLELQASGKQRAEDLAATFEVGKRTIYRDIQALCEAGVPVISTPGQGYTLLEGYFLPPLRFTPDEALMLLLGGDAMAQSFDAEYRAAAQSAGRKIAGALPEPLRDEVRSLQASIRFVAEGAPGRPSRPICCASCGARSSGGTRLRFRYHARHSQDGAERLEQPRGRPVWPGACRSAHGILVAYCHLRQDIRYFRIDRMDQLAVLPQTFTRPPISRLSSATTATSGESLCARCSRARSPTGCGSSRPFFTVAEERRADGLLVTLRVRHEREIIQWLLGWGASCACSSRSRCAGTWPRRPNGCCEYHGSSESLLT